MAHGWHQDSTRMQMAFAPGGALPPNRRPSLVGDLFVLGSDNLTQHQFWQKATSRSSGNLKQMSSKRTLHQETLLCATKRRQRLSLSCLWSFCVTRFKVLA